MDEQDIGRDFLEARGAQCDPPLLLAGQRRSRRFAPGAPSCAFCRRTLAERTGPGRDSGRNPRIVRKIVRWLVDGLLAARQLWGSKTSGAPDSPGRSRTPELTSAVARRQQRLPLPFPPEEPAQRSPAMTPQPRHGNERKARGAAHIPIRHGRRDSCADVRSATRAGRTPAGERSGSAEPAGHTGHGGEARRRRRCEERTALRSIAQERLRRPRRRRFPASQRRYMPHIACRAHTPPAAMSEAAPVEAIAQCDPPERRGAPHPSWAAVPPHKN